MIGGGAVGGRRTEGGEAPAQPEPGPGSPTPRSRGGRFRPKPDPPERWDTEDRHGRQGEPDRTGLGHRRDESPLNTGPLLESIAGVESAGLCAELRVEDQIRLG